MDDVTRLRSAAFCLFLIGFCIALLIGNRWPKLGDTYLNPLLALLMKLFAPRP